MSSVAPEFSVTVKPYEKNGSNIRGLARIYFEDSFIVNNVNLLQGKDNLFVTMPSYRTKQTDEQGKPIYQDVCYPVTKEFREKLCDEIIAEYEKAKEKTEDKSKTDDKSKSSDRSKTDDKSKTGTSNASGGQEKVQDKEELPFR